MFQKIAGTLTTTARIRAKAKNVSCLPARLAIPSNKAVYVDDDGHFQRLVDTVIELKKEIEELKGKIN